MGTEATRHDQLQKLCKEFHSKYPEVWEEFVGMTLKVIERGFPKYSAQTIWEVMRWHKDVGADGVTQFKLNHNFVPFYARRFHRLYPQYGNFFELRVQPSKSTPATDRPPFTPRQVRLDPDE